MQTENAPVPTSPKEDAPLKTTSPEPIAAVAVENPLLDTALFSERISGELRQEGVPHLSSPQQKTDVAVSEKTSVTSERKNPVAEWWDGLSSKSKLAGSLWAGSAAVMLSGAFIMQPFGSTAFFGYLAASVIDAAIAAVYFTVGQKASTP